MCEIIFIQHSEPWDRCFTNVHDYYIVFWLTGIELYAAIFFSVVQMKYKGGRDPKVGHVKNTGYIITICVRSILNFTSCSDQIFCETKGYLFQLYAGMYFFSTGPLSQASTTLKQRSVPVPSCHWSTTSPSCMVPMMPSTWQKSLGLFTLLTALFTKAEVCCCCVKTCLIL